MDLQKHLDTIEYTLHSGKPVKLDIPSSVLVQIDRKHPFVLVYRETGINNGTQNLLSGESSIFILRNKNKTSVFKSLLMEILSDFKREFGCCLLIEIWDSPSETKNNIQPLIEKKISPKIKIHCPEAFFPIGRIFHEQLSHIKLNSLFTRVETSLGTKCRPHDTKPLLTTEQAKKNGFHYIGLEVESVYWDNKEQLLYPKIHQRFKKSFSINLRKSLFKYTNKYSIRLEPHFHSLGRRNFTKLVNNVDKTLASISEELSLLLYVTPVNVESEWKQFKKTSYQAIPNFHYRPLAFSPARLKQKLYSTTFDKIEDPALNQVFLEKVVELDRQITLLQDRGTKNFLHESRQLYGETPEKTIDTAKQILNLKEREKKEKKQFYSAQEFSILCKEKLKEYQKTFQFMDNQVHIRNDVSGIMVCSGNIFLSPSFKVSHQRAKALMAHEIETHILTYLNGKAQPFHQMHVGLANCESLQEGIAVLSEVLVDSPCLSRLKLLAIRVIAVEMMINGADFIECFRLINSGFGIPKYRAFIITMRVYRGGGFTKDYVYLQGLMDVFSYIHSGKDFSSLLVGKIALNYVPIVNELLWRKVLIPPAILPSYMDNKESLAKLETIRKGFNILDIYRKEQ
jgi:uncharacterized protein (TIGR02421 family)